MLAKLHHHQRQQQPKWESNILLSLLHFKYRLQTVFGWRFLWIMYGWFDNFQYSICFVFLRKLPLIQKKKKKYQNSHSKIQSLPNVVLDFKHVERKKNTQNVILLWILTFVRLLSKMIENYSKNQIQSIVLFLFIWKNYCNRIHGWTNSF